MLLWPPKDYFTNIFRVFEAPTVSKPGASLSQTQTSSCSRRWGPGSSTVSSQLAFQTASQWSHVLYWHMCVNLNELVILSQESRRWQLGLQDCSSSAHILDNLPFTLTKFVNYYFFRSVFPNSQTWVETLELHSGETATGLPNLASENASCTYVNLRTQLAIGRCNVRENIIHEYDYKFRRDLQTGTITGEELISLDEREWASISFPRLFISLKLVYNFKPLEARRKKSGIECSATVTQFKTENTNISSKKTTSICSPYLHC